MLLTTLPDVRRQPRRVAIGSFDGIHLGHRELMTDCSTVLTFDPHPMSVLRPDRAPVLLTDRAQKMRRLAALGVAEVVVIPFDQRWARQSAAQFVDDVLVGVLDARHITVGADFRFGSGGTGDTHLLRADSRFGTRVVPLLTVGGEVVSSTLIRRLVAAGKVDKASALLGAPLTYTGRLRRGNGRGEPAGWIDVDPVRAIPRPGIYACRINGGPGSVRVGSQDSRLFLTATTRSVLHTRQDAVITVEFLGDDTEMEKSA